MLLLRALGARPVAFAAARRVAHTSLPRQVWLRRWSRSCGTVREVASDKGADKDAYGDEEVDIPPEVSELFDTLRGEAMRRLDDFAPIHLFSLCWAYSTARLLDDSMSQQITKAALRLGAAKDRQSPRSESSTADCEPVGIIAGSSDGNGIEKPYVAYASDHWLALYKPAHWQVSVDSKEALKAAQATPFEDEDEGDGEDDAVGDRPRLHTWIRQNLAQKFPICTDATEAFGLLHRLDAQTSGLIVCAKSYVGAYWLRLQWCSYAVDKEYVCLVHGWVDRSQREIHKRIRIEKRKAPNSRRTISTHCTVGPNGKPSYTELYTLAHLQRPAAQGDEEGERYSLVALKLHTGRTHQIRVHMLSIGHPLVTDAKYAEDRLSADKTWCPRNFLHTYRLAFRDVPSSQELEDGACSAMKDLLHPLPQDLRQTLSGLKPADAISERHVQDWLTGDAARLQAFEAYVQDEVNSPASAAPA